VSHPLLDGSAENRAAAITALAGRAEAPSPDELDALRDCLGEASKLLQRRAAEAFRALAARGVNVESRLRAALEAADLRLRWGAAYALALIRRLPLEALPALLEVMGLEDGDLRWAAADLVKQLAAAHGGAVNAHLLAAARKPGASRKMALYCLRDLDVVEASDVALAALADERGETRLAALALLARVYPDRAAAASRIAELIDDADPRMQRAAAGTLGSLGIRNDHVIAALRRVRASEDSSLRRAATRSLRLLRA
jgi:HEAT repeats